MHSGRFLITVQYLASEQSFLRKHHSQVHDCVSSVSRSPLARRQQERRAEARRPAADAVRAR